MATAQPPTFFVEDSNALMHPRDRSNERRRLEFELKLAKEDTEAALKALDTAVARLEANPHMFLTLPSGLRVEVRHVDAPVAEIQGRPGDLADFVYKIANMVDEVASEQPGHRDDLRSPRGALSAMAQRLRERAISEIAAG